MSDRCSHDHGHGGHDHNHTIEYDPSNKAFKRVLWISLILNFGMFFVEVIYGVLSNSLSLRADAIDFLGDGANYFVTLFILNSALKTKAKVSSAKAIFMLVFGAWILVEAVMRFFSHTVPDSFTMSWVGVMALAANALCALLLFKFKDGDSNMQSVWLCSRNDAIGNVAVIVASGGVYWWGTQWPDLVVAIFMASLAVHSGAQILRSARNELTHGHHKGKSHAEEHKHEHGENCNHDH
ncbi:MAG: cation diffusion facilitator family transporter [Rhizobacter sp.]|nr:cation diffusion facilitator family transporter [Bacteriovorax sp.]